MRRSRNHWKEWGAQQGLPVKDMTPQVYNLRRRVMGFIYEARNLVKFDRVEIRITDRPTQTRALACAACPGGASKGHAILISTEAVQASDQALRHIVFHELLHAILGTSHDESCPLMASAVNLERPVTKARAHQLFVKYFRNQNQ